jgi:hypothetical protein
MYTIGCVYKPFHLAPERTITTKALFTTSIGISASQCSVTHDFCLSFQSGCAGAKSVNGGRQLLPFERQAMPLRYLFAVPGPKP